MVVLSPVAHFGRAKRGATVAGGNAPHRFIAIRSMGLALWASIMRKIEGKTYETDRDLVAGFG
jgi:hypothetical protein